MREEEAKRKAEVKAQKAALREAKQCEKEAQQRMKQQEKDAKRREKEAKGKGPAKRKSENPRPIQKKVRNDADEEIDDGRCCICFGTYVDDAGTDRNWIMCSCGRWMHEDCMDDGDVDYSTNKLCPLC